MYDASGTRTTARRERSGTSTTNEFDRGSNKRDYLPDPCFYRGVESADFMTAVGLLYIDNAAGERPSSSSVALLSVPRASTSTATATSTFPFTFRGPRN